MVRANRVRVYVRHRPPKTGLGRGELFYVIGARTEYDLSRRGLWLVLDYFMGAARYRVLHHDSLGRAHDVLINVGDLESDNQFRLVRKRRGKSWTSERRSDA